MSATVSSPASEAYAFKHVIQGQWLVSNDANVVLKTILGSCVAACLWDEETKVGGLNHFLLPGTGEADRNAQCRYGSYAMELLLNDLYRAGARRGRIKAKLFGGAKLFNSQDIGGLNAEFAQKFLRDEGIPCVGGSLRGNQGRRIEFWPTSGRARQIYLAQDLVPSEPAPPRAPAPKGGGDVEFF